MMGNIVIDAPTTEAPAYAHPACAYCTFLGRHSIYDLYHCSHDCSVSCFQAPGLRGKATVIARYGSERDHLISGLDFARSPNFPYLNEALKRALERGLDCRLGRWFGAG